MIYACLDTGIVNVVLFIDIKKAFDPVNDSILLEKMFYAGFRGFIHNDRTVRKKVNNVFSNVVLSVPQDSVLGLILFFVYINSNFIQRFKSKITAKADDLALSFQSSHGFDLTSDFNHD